MSNSILAENDKKKCSVWSHYKNFQMPYDKFLNFKVENWKKKIVKWTNNFSKANTISKHVISTVTAVSKTIPLIQDYR